MTEIDDALRVDLEDLDRRGLHRRLRRLDARDGAHAMLDGRSVLVFGSNDYLGLAGHPKVRAAASEAATAWGAGATGSRLTTGDLAPHKALEAELAAFKGTEAALLFSSGFAANVGTIPALVGPGDLILSDALNHASLIDGCRLSRAEVRVYRHADAGHAHALLADRGAFRRALLVTDGVFSMDGDIAPLPALASVCESADAWLMVDDAHGNGVLGPTGRGTVEHFGLLGRVPIHMGTLSKALGSAGGFVAGSHTLIEWLRQRARSFFYSTASPPPTVAAARAALMVTQEEPERRARVLAHAARMRDGLSALGFEVLPGETPIIPVIIGEASEAMRLSAALESQGIWVTAIRPPTVPPGTARLRVTVTAAHTDADITEALEAFARLEEP